MVKSAGIERVKSIKLNLQYLAAGTLHEMLVLWLLVWACFVRNCLYFNYLVRYDIQLIAIHVSNQNINLNVACCWAFIILHTVTITLKQVCTLCFYKLTLTTIYDLEGRKLVFINLLVSLALDSYIIYKYQGQDLKEKCVVCMW